MGMSTQNIFAANESTTNLNQAFEIADNYILKTDNENSISISNPEELKNLVGEEKFSIIEQSVNLCNQTIELENLSVSQNGTIYDNNDEYELQGGNIKGTKYFWWGCKIFHNNEQTKKMVRDLKNQNSYANSSIMNILSIPPVFGEQHN